MASECYVIGSGVKIFYNSANNEIGVSVNTIGKHPDRAGNYRCMMTKAQTDLMIAELMNFKRRQEIREEELATIRGGA